LIMKRIRSGPDRRDQARDRLRPPCEAASTATTRSGVRAGQCQRPCRARHHVRRVAAPGMQLAHVVRISELLVPRYQRDGIWRPLSLCRHKVWRGLLLQAGRRLSPAARDLSFAVFAQSRSATSLKAGGDHPNPRSSSVSRQEASCAAISEEISLRSVSMLTSRSALAPGVGNGHGPRAASRRNKLLTSMGRSQRRNHSRPECN